MAKNKDTYRRMLAAAVGLVSVLACGCAGGGTVDHGGDLMSEEGQIAFMRATDFNPPHIETDIYMTNVDGTGERRLTDSQGLDGFPTWSPDGERIAFATDRDGGGNWEIYVMDSDGRHQRRLTNTPEQKEAVPAWSPDGEHIAYVVDLFGENPAIWVMNADGSERRQLTGASWPSWSPDGERIVYTVYSGAGEGRLFVMDAGGSERRRLAGSLIRRLTDTADGEEPAWSPDGERIAFSTNVGMDNAEIFAMDSDGSDRTRLTDIPGNDHWPPTWSPDSSRIAFTSDGTKGIGEIYVMNADGSGLTKLTDNPADDAFPAWRP
jgi:TolB protein